MRPINCNNCAPIVRAWEAGEKESIFFENSQTLAFGINVPKALGDCIVLEAIENTQGCIVAVEEEAILEGMGLIAREDGQFICPEGACALMAAAQLRQNGWIGEEERVVILNTGMGIKYPDALHVELPYVEKGGSL